MSDTTSEALWVGDGIRVRADGVLEDWAAHPDGTGSWVDYRGSLYPSDLREPLRLMAIQARRLESFRQALPESERGPGWERAVLTAIDTRREVLAAVDAHVQGWHPGREPAEVVAHLTDEIALLRDAERGAQEVAAEALAALRKAEAERDAAKAEVEHWVGHYRASESGWQNSRRLNAEIARERDDLKARLAAAESARDGNARQVDALRDWEKDAAASLRRLTAQLDALREAARPFVMLAAQENEIEALKSKPSSYEVLHLCDDFGRYRAVSLRDCRALVAAFANAYPGQSPLAPGGAPEPVSPAYRFDTGEARVGCIQGDIRTPEDKAALEELLAASERLAKRLFSNPQTVAQERGERRRRQDTPPAVLSLLEPEADPYVSRVTEFHRAMGLPVRLAPSVGTAEERILRVRLLLEEVLEYATASAVRVELAGFRIKGTGELTIGENVGATPDLVAMTHELGDCQVIVSGCAVQLGLPLLAAVSEEIHPANMRKLGPDGRPVLRADGKVGKPEGWQPANVARIVERALAAGEVSHG